MAIKSYIAVEEEIIIYNGQPVLNYPFYFYYCEDEPFDFPNNDGTGFLRIYNERDSMDCNNLIKEINLTIDVNTLIITTQDLNFTDNGKYYYELGYVQNGGYQIVLLYGVANVQ